MSAVKHLFLRRFRLKLEIKSGINFIIFGSGLLSMLRSDWLSYY